MRILHLDLGKEMRGGQWQVLRLIEGLAAAGVESTLLARPGSPLFEAARRGGWRVEPISLWRVIRLSRHHDLIHAHDARGHTLGVLAPLLAGGGACPTVVSRRVAFPVRSPWKYKRPARFIAVSEFVKSVLIEGGVAPEKIAVVYDGVPLLEPARGVDIISPSLKSGALAKQAARLAGVTLKLSSNLQDDLTRAALCIYISESEGLGSGVLMAMSAGVPVVASRVGGLREIIQHGANGMLVANTPESIATAIRELTQDSDLARRMGEAARRTVMEKFTVDLMVRRTIEVYVGQASRPVLPDLQ
jgi:glycosyltransferase involved in cell wall biosynthesis